MKKISWFEKNNYQDLNLKILSMKAKSLGLTNPENYDKFELIDFIAGERAENPNTSPDELLLLSFDFPGLVFINKVFPVILKEKPDFFQKIIDNYSEIQPIHDYALFYYLRNAADIPEDFQKVIVSDVSDRSIIFKRYLLENPNISPDILELTIEFLVNGRDRDVLQVPRNRDYFFALILKNPKISARILNRLTKKNIINYGFQLAFCEQVDRTTLKFIAFYHDEDEVISDIVAWRIRTKRYSK